jgi:hypothetical protein
MPSILVVYYSQTGQLLNLAQNMLSEMPADTTVQYEQIVPETAFPFPWQTSTFFDAMPECVLQVPITLKPPTYLNQHFDLVILAWQPWFLSPSPPISSWLQQADIQLFLKNKNILTLCGCRNMWTQAHQKIKQHLQIAQANLVGHVMCEDRAPNLVSVLTIMRWMFEGQKEASKWLPPAGVNQADVVALKKAGQLIVSHLKTNNWTDLQPQLVKQGFVNIKPHLVLLEENGSKTFLKFAHFIREKGGAGDANRTGRVNVFKRVLIVSIFILSPISSFVATIASLVRRRYVQNEITYYQSTTCR